MALTDYLTEEEIKKISGKPFGIDFESRFDKKEFVERTADLFSVRELSTMLGENSGNIHVLNKLIGLVVEYMPGDKRENIALLRQNPYLVLEQGELLYSAGVDSMVKFIRNNRKETSGKLSKEEFYSLIKKASLMKVKAGSLDEIVDSTDDETLKGVFLSYAIENRTESKEYGELAELVLDVNERTKNLKNYKENPEGSKELVAKLADKLRAEYIETYDDKDLLEVLKGMAEGVAIIKYNEDYIEKRKELEAKVKDYVVTLGNDRLIEVYTGLLEKSSQTTEQSYAQAA